MSWVASVTALIDVIRAGRLSRSIAWPTRPDADATLGAPGSKRKASLGGALRVVQPCCFLQCTSAGLPYSQPTCTMSLRPAGTATCARARSHTAEGRGMGEKPGTGSGQRGACLVAHEQLPAQLVLQHLHPRADCRLRVASGHPASRDLWLCGRSECAGAVRPGPSRGSRMASLRLGAASKRSRRVSGVSSSTRHESWSGSWWVGVAGMVRRLGHARQSQHQPTR